MVRKLLRCTTPFIPYLRRVGRFLDGFISLLARSFGRHVGGCRPKVGLSVCRNQQRTIVWISDPGEPIGSAGARQKTPGIEPVALSFPRYREVTYVSAELDSNLSSS